MAVSKSKRFKVFSRDNFTCVYCGRNSRSVSLEVDHVVPRSKGGSDDESNLATSCFDCNRSKSDAILNATSVCDMLIDNSEQATKMAKAETARIKAARAEKAEFNKLKRDIETLIKMTVNVNGERSITNFLKELHPSSVIEAAEIASESRRGMKAWKYFCGICWSKIKRARLDEMGAE
jgi:CRISPR/Cas system Type II protein with McrA/HNH and RuvC-like nuclease domain